MLSNHIAAILCLFPYDFFCHSIDEGIPLKEIRARMGHKSIPTTMDTYGHLYKDRRGAIGEHLQNMHVAAEASKEKEDGGDGKGTGNLTEK